MSEQVGDELSAQSRLTVIYGFSNPNTLNKCRVQAGDGSTIATSVIGVLPLIRGLIPEPPPA